MKDKFSLYQADGFWGIIEDSSDEKQTSVKSYIGADLIIKRLNEQADQINQLKQRNEELMLQLSKYEIEKHKPAYCALAGTECQYLGEIEKLKQQLAETEQEFLVFQEDSARNEQIYIRELAEKQNTIDKINKEFVQAVHDWKALCAKKDEEIEKLKLKLDIRAMSLQNINTERIESERNQTQLAIQELEKVKDWLNEPFDEDGCFKIGGDLIDFIDQQINDLRGEKDE